MRNGQEDDQLRSRHATPIQPIIRGPAEENLISHDGSAEQPANVCGTQNEVFVSLGRVLPTITLRCSHERYHFGRERRVLRVVFWT